MSLAELGRLVQALAIEVHALPDRIAETYVRRDVAEERDRYTHARIDSIADDLREVKTGQEQQAEQRRGDRRLAVSGLVLPLIVVVLGGVLVWALTGGGR